MKKKALVLIDYENLYMPGMDQGLEMTNKGFEHFISNLHNTYEIEDGMISVICRFRDFNPLFQNFVQSLSVETIDAIDRGKDVADGYLIVEAVKKLMDNQYSIDEVVIVGGDNVYSGLVRNIVNFFRKSVKVISWEDSLADSLTLINQRKVAIEYVEEVFNFGEGNEISQGWFKNDDCSDLEFAVISFIAKSRFSNGYHLNTLSNKLVESTDPRVTNLQEYYQTRDWLTSQVGQLDLFIQERKERGIMFKLNPVNSKVQFVLNRLGISIS